MGILHEKQKADKLTTGTRDPLIRWIWRVIWSLTFLLPASKKRDSLTRWAWGIACVTLGTCFLWYAIQCVAEAGTNTTGGYVSYEDWGEWVGPAHYRRHKWAEAFGMMIGFVVCAVVADVFLTVPDALERHKSYFTRHSIESGGRIDALGCAFLISQEAYLDAGWKRIDRKTARALAKQPPGRYFCTVGGPDRFCSQRDYLSFVRNQKREEDIPVLVEK